MITLTVFIQGLQRTKRKTGSQYNKKNEYMKKSNRSLPDLPFPNRYLFKSPVL